MGIIGGVEAGEGVVLSMGPNMTEPVDVWKVLETNYDHWDKAPVFDDRRTPAEDCMDNFIKKEGVSKAGLYDVLTPESSRNRLTTFTAIIDCAAGELEATYQYCWEDSCAIF